MVVFVKTLPLILLVVFKALLAGNFKLAVATPSALVFAVYVLPLNLNTTVALLTGPLSVLTVAFKVSCFPCVPVIVFTEIWGCSAVVSVVKLSL